MKGDEFTTGDLMDVPKHSMKHGKQLSSGVSRSHSIWQKRAMKKKDMEVSQVKEGLNLKR
jgi:hypothetical protein